MLKTFGKILNYRISVVRYFFSFSVWTVAQWTMWCISTSCVIFQKIGISLIEMFPIYVALPTIPMNIWRFMETMFQLWFIKIGYTIFPLITRRWSRRTRIFKNKLLKVNLSKLPTFLPCMEPGRTCLDIQQLRNMLRAVIPKNHKFFHRQLYTN